MSSTVSALQEAMGLKGRERRSASVNCDMGGVVSSPGDAVLWGHTCGMASHIRLGRGEGETQNDS